jgi:hypothetical protein
LEAFVKGHKLCVNELVTLKGQMKAHVEEEISMCFEKWAHFIITVTFSLNFYRLMDEKRLLYDQALL